MKVYRKFLLAVPILVDLISNELVHALCCHVQEEYQAEGITWHNIDYIDNVGCIHLISKKPTGLLYLLDEESK